MKGNRSGGLQPSVGLDVIMLQDRSGETVFCWLACELRQYTLSKHGRQSRYEFSDFATDFCIVCECIGGCRDGRIPRTQKRMRKLADPFRLRKSSYDSAFSRFSEHSFCPWQNLEACG